MSTSSQSSPQISLTPPEQLFRKCLLDCRNEMKDVPGMENLVLRWTGGWVRDKLLGTSSHDIDVALSTMTGMQFGQALKIFMEKSGHRYEKEAEAGGFKAEIKNLHKIAANPEKSKHLETITTRMFGIDVDFVNLRKEVYDNVSRNPQIEFGTPEEDALRRDATVNALFYNLDEQRVEDFTHQGLEDMGRKIIRTPLEPYQTFRDDPLRVLRLIRFATRLGYDIESEALKSMQDTTIHEALQVKISRERVGVEIGKIAAGPDPHRGWMLIHDLNLYETVFSDPSIRSHPDFRTQPLVYDSLATILKDNDTLCSGLRLNDDPSLIWILAAYVPWKDSETEAVSAARLAIRATNTVSKVLGDAIRHRERLRNTVENVEANRASRGEVGMLLRAIGHTWPIQTMYSLLCDLDPANYATVTGRYVTFIRWLRTEKMTNASSLKLMLNGNQIKQILGVQNAGPWLKSAIDAVAEWQFNNPEGTSTDVQSYIRSRKDEFV